MANTGFKIFQNLQQYDTITGLPTGVIKPNVSTDPDYIEPIYDINSCPIGSVGVSLNPVEASYLYNDGVTPVGILPVCSLNNIITFYQVSLTFNFFEPLWKDQAGTIPADQGFYTNPDNAPYSDYYYWNGTSWGGHTASNSGTCDPNSQP